MPPPTAPSSLSPYWGYSPIAEKDFQNKIRAYQEYQIDSKTFELELKHLKKEQLLAVLEEEIDRDVPKGWWPQLQAHLLVDDLWVSGTQSYLGDRQLIMKTNLYYIDRLKVEPGTLNEIFHRWLKEYSARQKAFHARSTKWSIDTSSGTLVQMGFKVGDYERSDRGHEQFFKGLKREGVWTNTEKALISGLILVFRKIVQHESKLQEAEDEKAWRMAEMQKEAEKLKQEQEEEEEKKRKAEEEERQREEEEEMRVQKEKQKKEKRKAKQKKEQDEINDSVNSELKDTMAKMAVYQTTLALLQADLMAGKITPEIFSAKVTEASALIN